MEKNYEVARLGVGIPKNSFGINFHNGRGDCDSGLGYFVTLDEAKKQIQSYKATHPSENWPYVIIHYQNEHGRVVYIEYIDTCLIEKKLGE